jgi:hypothetical protein
MPTVKSPFYVVEEFMSPKICEQIVDSLGFYAPDTDPQGNPIKMYRYKEDAELMVFDHLKPYIPKIMAHYDTEYQATETIQFEYFAEGITPTPVCENSNYLNKKWVRSKSRDLTGVLFFYDYNEVVPFDSDYECYGGKLEFPQHNFSFVPQRGQLVIYPSVPHFINATSMIEYGEMVQARIHMVTKLPYLYDPNNFPGNYQSWF